MYIEVNNLTKHFAQKEADFYALSDVSLSIEQGEFICLLGPSGCGKTTLLNTMAGFVQATSGSVTIDDQVVKKPCIEHITLFQNYGLLPWRTVQHNVELGLEGKNKAKEEISKIASQYLELVGLADFCKSYPHQLSGGMQQRAAIARALAVNPKILFMDEPFGALDVITRANMQDEITRIWQERNQTIVFVTHDVDEAVYLADRVVIMTPNPGRIKEIVTVNLGRRRDRTGEDFFRVRDKILEIFEMKHYDPIEYNL